MKILIVDDHITTIKTVALILKSAGFTDIIECVDSSKTMTILENNEIELVLLDIEMPNLSGDVLLPQIKKSYPSIDVIMLTGVNDVNMIVKLIKDGATDYLLKPPDRNRILEVVKKVSKIKKLEGNIKNLKDAIFKKAPDNIDAFKDIKTISYKMFTVFKYIEAIKDSKEPVLIIGETGTGKELIASSVHKISNREGKFISINIAGLNDELFSDTIFGHVKGAFTGAVNDRVGLIEQANNGTLFLYEIGDLELNSQIKLLRLLQEGTYFPLGSDKEKKSNIKIVMATNKNLEEMVSENKFRKDLYYRIYTHQIELPPLKERKDDIPILVNHFVKNACESMGKNQLLVPNELLILLKNYDFPGNLRELRALIFDAVSQTESKVTLSKNIIQERIYSKPEIVPVLNFENNEKIIFTDNLPTLKEIEILLINEAMKRSENNQSIASQLLGVTRQALNQRLKKMDS
jgi:DNA-binding NtrC family response regulator